MFHQPLRFDNVSRNDSLSRIVEHMCPLKRHHFGFTGINQSMDNFGREVHFLSATPAVQGRGWRSEKFAELKVLALSTCHFGCAGFGSPVERLCSGFVRIMCGVVHAQRDVTRLVVVFHAFDRCRNSRNRMGTAVGLQVMVAQCK